MGVEIQKLTGYNKVGNHKRKRQILLVHTARDAKEYLQSLKYRYNGKYTRVPHYLITKDGQVLEFLSPDTYSNYFSEYDNSREVIIVALENLGWLKKNPLNASYINWIGNIYNQEPYERKWRGHFFWDPYTDEQIQSSQQLCLELCERFEIPKTVIGHNVKVDFADLYEGVLTKSNYTTHTTDLSPAFDYEEFVKVFENEPV
jgi:N-acetyl-anhydromuramyl-L-alanine amidase AmpD